MQIVQSRRRFLATASLASAAALVGAPKSLHAEPPLETTTVHLLNYGTVPCSAPVLQSILGELLHAEGFADVRYANWQSNDASGARIASGEVDFDYNFPAIHVAWIEAGVPIKVIAGAHSGCLELLGNGSVHKITDLKGKKVGVDGDDPNDFTRVLVSLMVAYVGLDPDRDIQWISRPGTTAMGLFVDGKVDAFLALPPQPQELHDRKVGRSILTSTDDPPWSQYFCCQLAASAEYVSRYPVATKRVLRATLKAEDLCASQPELVAQGLVKSGFTDGYDYALQSLTEVPFARWREFDSEDSLRFYALRMHEAAMIKSSPRKIIADGADWRFINELKRELKG